MKDMVLLGRLYTFPEIKDGRFESLQSEIRDMRDRIQDGSEEKRFLGIFRKQPSMDAGERIRLMEELVNRYDEMIASLKEKIGACTATFNDVGDGIQEHFKGKLGELESMERKRLDLLAEATAKGQTAMAAGIETEERRVRGLVLNLTRASVLMIRKLRHALAALETLVDEEATQRKVLDSLKGDVSLYRRTYEFTRDLDEMERDITAMTRLALEFDNVLRDNLGPLGVLIDEVTKVDARVAESLVEIERLSAQIEADHDAGAFAAGFDDRILGALTRSRLRSDALESIISAMSDPSRDLGEVEFAVDVSGPETLDFRALAANMGDLVRRGLEDLRATGATRVLGADATIAPQAEKVATEEACAAPPSSESVEPDGAEQEYEAQPAASAQAADPEPMASGATVGEGGGAQKTPEPDWVSAMKHKGSEASASAVKGGSYRRSISRQNPTLIVFLLDRSGSMGEPYAHGLSKAEYLARSVDRCLLELSVSCNKAGGLRDYFQVACLGYSEDGVRSAFAPPLSGEDYVTMSRLVASPLRLDTERDGTKVPVWIEPQCSGGTPMRAAFAEACRFVASWCDDHPSSYPPTVIHVTDGQSTDGDPAEEASILRRLHTDDGECLLFNLHVRSGGGREVVFPDSPAGLDEYGSLLFGMSSSFPPHLEAMARQMGLQVGPTSRFFAYGAGAEIVSRFFRLGTSTTALL